MSEFSAILEKFIKEKNVKIYSMVKYCNLDRSAMYKLMNGKRKPPAPEVFHKMAEFLRLTPLEYDAFKNAYEITLVGSDLWYQRRNVEDFILNFPSGSVFPSPLSAPRASDYANGSPENTVKGNAITNRFEFEHTLHDILVAEAGKASGKVALLLQPDSVFPFSLLVSLNSKETPLRIEHTFCLSNAAQLTADHKCYNLSYLKRILPLYMSNMNYHPYYFYDDIQPHYYNFNGFPYMILTSTHAILCTSDYKNGILFHDSAILKMLWQLYDSYQNKCSKLFHVTHSVLDECTAFGSMNWDSDVSYLIQPEPCLIPHITREIFENAINPSISKHPAMFDFLWDYITFTKTKLSEKNLHVYHTKAGVQAFAETGRISEIPDEVYRPFTVPERIELLEQFMNQCSDCNSRLLKAPLKDIPASLHLCINESSGYLLFGTSHSANEQNVYLVLEEPGLLSAFYDYAESLDDKKLYSSAETAAFLQSVIDSLKEKC